MLRIMMIGDLIKFNARSENLEQSIELLKDFLIDESSEAFLKGDNNIFGDRDDFIKLNKHLVAKLDKSKIEIYSNEHPPAHFHFNIGEYKSTYDITTGSKLEGNMPNKYENKLILWYRNGGKEKLIDKWNNSRPSDCTVGKFK